LKHIIDTVQNQLAPVWVIYVTPIPHTYIQSGT